MKHKAPVSIDTAIRIYYQYPEIGNAQIRELFGLSAGLSTVCRYKKPVLEAQAANGVMTAQPYTVDTETAYKVWGIDVEDLIRRREKLQKLKLA